MLARTPTCRWGAARVFAAASGWLATPAWPLIATASPLLLGRVTTGLCYRRDVVRSLLTSTPAPSLGTARTPSRYPVHIIGILFSLDLQSGQGTRCCKGWSFLVYLLILVKLCKKLK